MEAFIENHQLLVVMLTMLIGLPAILGINGLILFVVCEFVL